MGKKSDKVVIQSFVSYRLELNFRYTEDDKEKGIKKGDVVTVSGQPKTVKVPSKQESPKNILILSAEHFAQVKHDLEGYIALGQREGVVILDDIPSGYWDPAQRVAEAESGRASAEAQLAGAKTQIEAKDARIAELKDILIRTFAWKDDGK